MMRPIRTAVAASATPIAQRQLLRALAREGIELLAFAEDGRTAWSQLEAHRPDLLAVDLELPALDGAELARRALCGYTLPVRPAVLLMHYSEFAVPEESDLAQLGAATLWDTGKEKTCASQGKPEHQGLPNHRCARNVCLSAAHRPGTYHSLVRRMRYV